MQSKKILFLGETYRPDAQTWMNGLKEFGNFEIITWELKTPNNGLKNRILRILEYSKALSKIKKIIKTEKLDFVIAERTTSYGFLAALTNCKNIVIAQQGRTDLWPESSFLYPLKKAIQKYAFKKATLIHAWGPLMVKHMIDSKVNEKKILMIPKGIDLRKFSFKNQTQTKISAIVTRSLMPEYQHEIILKAFGILNQKNIDFSLTIVGNGTEKEKLITLSKTLNINEKVIFTNQINNSDLPEWLQKSNFYISMPTTEGVSASLFEAMACGCYPIVSKIDGNESWINHRKNGQLVTVGNVEMLANEIIWALENVSYREKVLIYNNEYVQKNANYEINMKHISQKYLQLIDF